MPAETQRRLPGGQLPDIGTLVSESFTDFTENLAPYVLGYLGVVVVSVPVTILLIIAIYFLMFVGMMAVMVVMVGAIAALGEDVGLVVGVFAELVGFMGLFVMFAALGAVIRAFVAPFNASLYRAMAAQQRGEGDMEFGAAFQTIKQDIVPVVLVNVAYGMLIAVGLMMCYLPALLVPLCFGFADTLVALGRKTMGRAFAENFEHLKENPAWHGTYLAVSIGLMMVAQYIPILGTAFMVSLHVRTYRYLWGDPDSADGPPLTALPPVGA
jgi:hypothetical protein